MINKNTGESPSCQGGRKGILVILCKRYFETIKKIVKNIDKVVKCTLKISENVV